MNKLIIVGLSIGNIEDISIRALRHIYDGKVVLAEDTREFIKLKRILADRYAKFLVDLDINIDNRAELISYREQNHERILPNVIRHLEQNDVILVSDSGMPGVSDPGWLLIRDLIEKDVEIDVIPGPTALITALVLSGLPTDRFSFIGFLPRTSGRAEKLLNLFTNDQSTVLIYESPFRILKTVELLKKMFEESVNVALVGEITKKFQKVVRGTPSSVIEQMKSVSTKGEWVICVRKIKEI